MFSYFGCKACEVLASWPGFNSTSSALEGEVLTTGPPGKSYSFHSTLNMSSFTEKIIIVWKVELLSRARRKESEQEGRSCKKRESRLSLKVIPDDQAVEYDPRLPMRWKLPELQWPKCSRLCPRVALGRKSVGRGQTGPKWRWPFERKEQPWAKVELKVNVRRNFHSLEGCEVYH